MWRGLGSCSFGHISYRIRNSNFSCLSQFTTEVMPRGRGRGGGGGGPGKMRGTRRNRNDSNASPHVEEIQLEEQTVKKRKIKLETGLEEVAPVVVKVEVESIDIPVDDDQNSYSHQARVTLSESMGYTENGIAIKIESEVDEVPQLKMEESETGPRFSGQALEAKHMNLGKSEESHNSQPGALDQTNNAESFDVAIKNERHEIEQTTADFTSNYRNWTTESLRFQLVYFFCKLCPAEKFGCQTELDEHVAQKHEAEWRYQVVLHPCEQCPLQFEIYEDFNKHLWEKHNWMEHKNKRKPRPRPAPGSRSKPDQQEELLKCKICCKEYKTKTWLLRHEKTHSDRSHQFFFNCHRCSERYATQWELHGHLDNTHYNSDSYSDSD